VNLTLKRCLTPQWPKGAQGISNLWNGFAKAAAQDVFCTVWICAIPMQATMNDFTHSLFHHVPVGCKTSLHAGICPYSSTSDKNCLQYFHRGNQAFKVNHQPARCEVSKLAWRFQAQILLYPVQLTVSYIIYHYITLHYTTLHYANDIASTLNYIV
jgi:hypothetical protein